MKTCLNCGNFDSKDQKGKETKKPLCIAGCLSFMQQLQSGRTVKCEAWKEKG